MHPTVTRTWAPRGQTPVLFERGRHYQNTAALAAVITNHKLKKARVLFRLHPGISIKGPQVRSFVTALTRQLKGRLIIIWDRLNVHRSVVARYHNRRVSFEFLPAYAPELNPPEYLWRWLKYKPLANAAFLDLRSLHRATFAAARAAQGATELCASFLRRALHFLCKK